MADQYYNKPALPADAAVRSLVPMHEHGLKLTPETVVLCVHRGVEPLVDKYDGRDYEILPGFFEVAYGAALHFKARAVVPGSRNPETGKQESFIGIVGIDRPERCVPFTLEECERFNLIPEAIDRQSLSSRAAREAHLENVSAVLSRMPGAGITGHMRPQIDMSQQATPAAEAAAEQALTPPAHNEAQAEIANAEAEFAAEQAADAARRADVAAARAAKVGGKK
jgi:hypothetical protein